MKKSPNQSKIISVILCRQGVPHRLSFDHNAKHSPRSNTVGSITANAIKARSNVLVTPGSKRQGFSMIN